MEKILMTGATGAYGSEILKHLVACNVPVTCLVRASNHKQANERIRAILGKTNGVRAVPGDITEPMCGVSAYDQMQMKGEIDSILHCAAAISFVDEKLNYKVNVNGTNNLATLADTIGAWRWHHISTVYTAGEQSTLLETDSPSANTHQPRNYYEATKQISEAIARGWRGSMEDRRINIYRPSILIGRDDALGSTPTFDAFYGYVKPLCRMADAIRQKSVTGKLGDGVYLIDQRRVNAPIALKMKNDSTLNVVPIDWAARSMVDLLCKGAVRDSTFHLTHDEPPNTRWMLKVVLEHFGIKGVRVAESDADYKKAIETLPKGAAPFQRTVAPVLQQFDPYTNHNPYFGMQAHIDELGNNFRPPPRITEEFLKRLLNYAIEHNWEAPSSSALV